MFSRILIRSFDFLRLLWLAKSITSVWVFRHSIENCSDICNKQTFILCYGFAHRKVKIRTKLLYINIPVNYRALSFPTLSRTYLKVGKNPDYREHLWPRLQRSDPGEEVGNYVNFTSTLRCAVTFYHMCILKWLHRLTHHAPAPPQSYGSASIFAYARVKEKFMSPLPSVQSLWNYIHRGPLVTQGFLIRQAKNSQLSWKIDSLWLHVA